MKLFAIIICFMASTLTFAKVTKTLKFDSSEREGFFYGFLGLEKTKKFQIIDCGFSYESGDELEAVLKKKVYFEYYNAHFQGLNEKGENFIQTISIKRSSFEPLTSYLNANEDLALTELEQIPTEKGSHKKLISINKKDKSLKLIQRKSIDSKSSQFFLEHDKVEEGIQLKFVKNLSDKVDIDQMIVTGLRVQKSSPDKFEEVINVKCSKFVSPSESKIELLEAGD